MQHSMLLDAGMCTDLSVHDLGETQDT